MKLGQELVILFFLLFVIVAITIILKIVLNRLPKQKQNSLKHCIFYAMLPKLIGGQILIRSEMCEDTGIIDDIKFNKENNRINFSCSWTAERDNGKWSPKVPSWGKKYRNLFEEGTLFYMDEASIFVIKNNGFCIVMGMEGGQGVVFLYPKSEYIIKLEDIEGYEVMLPAVNRV